MNLLYYLGFVIICILFIIYLVKHLDDVKLADVSAFIMAMIITHYYAHRYTDNIAPEEP